MLSGTSSYRKGGNLKHIGAAINNQLLSDAEAEDREVESPTSHYSRRPRRRKERTQPAKQQHYKTIDISLGGERPQQSAFCSRSEAICAELLKRFVPHFRLQAGVTFQVPIGVDGRGNTLAVDFFVDGVLFEYHPARFFKNKKGFGDFKNKEEYKAYAKLFHSVGGFERELFHEAMKAHLKDNYYQRRRALLDRHPHYRRIELVVATNPEEFYALILCRFGRNIPKNLERFLELFDELRETLP
jgi:hypothetical protein